MNKELYQDYINGLSISELLNKYKIINKTRVYKEIAECSKEQSKVLNIIKEKVIWVENDKLMCGRYADIEIELDEEDFESKEEFDLLKEVLKDD